MSRPSPQLDLFASPADAAIARYRKKQSRERDVQAKGQKVEITAGESGRARCPGLSFCVLGSGSGGNSSVLKVDGLVGGDEAGGEEERDERAGRDAKVGRGARAGRNAILIDAGFGPFTTRRRLQQAGVSLEQVAGICLTHLDRDHWRPNWARTLAEHDIPVYLHRWHVNAARESDGLQALVEADLLRPFDDRFSPVRGLLARPIALPHDVKGTTGYVFETMELGEEDDAKGKRVGAHREKADSAGENIGALGANAGVAFMREVGTRLGYATDLGSVPPELIERFSEHGGVDLLAIECNYDPHLQQKSDRPAFLKRRIMGKQGHLSNEQCLVAVRDILDKAGQPGPSAIVLMHRSSQCNHPGIVEEVFQIEARCRNKLHLAEQRRRSKWLRATPRPAVLRRQSSLFRM